MAEYLGFLLSASAVVALGGLMAHGGRTANVVKLALGVMLLSVSVIPIVSAVCDVVSEGEIIFSESTQQGGTSGNLYEKTAEDAFCEGIKKLLVSEFSLTSDEVDVRIYDFKVEEMRANKVKVILSGRAVSADYRKICSRVEELELGRCEVELEID